MRSIRGSLSKRSGGSGRSGRSVGLHARAASRNLRHPIPRLRDLRISVFPLFCGSSDPYSGRRTTTFGRVLVPAVGGVNAPDPTVEDDNEGANWYQGRLEQLLWRRRRIGPRRDDRDRSQPLRRQRLPLDRVGYGSVRSGFLRVVGPTPFLCEKHFV
jgi:hypothetical protein